MQIPPVLVFGFTWMMSLLVLTVYLTQIKPL